YLAALQYALFRTRGVESQVSALSGSYTNAIQLKARYLLVNDRQALKFAALDCWKVVAELMPESVTLESWNFIDGKKLNLASSAPADQTSQLIDFESAMRKTTLEGQPLFDANKGEHLSYQGGAGTVRWSFGL